MIKYWCETCQSGVSADLVTPHPTEPRALCHTILIPLPCATCPPKRTIHLVKELK